MIGFRFNSTDGLDDLAERLDQAPRRLRLAARSELAAAGRPVKTAVQAAIRTAPMEQRRMWQAESPRRVGDRLGTGTSPLRAPIARAVTVRAEVAGSGANVQIDLHDEQVSPAKRWLIPHLVGRKKRLRHPFPAGGKARWRYAVQATKNQDSWWPVLRRHLPQFVRARDRAIERVRDYLS